MKTYAINICLIPDKKTYNICEKLNKLDNGDYNKNTLKYIPHTTLVMKYVDEKNLEFLKEKLKNIKLQKFNCKTINYCLADSSTGLWSAINIEKTKEIKNLQKQITNITKNIKNEKLKKEAHIVQDFFAENAGIALGNEEYFLNTENIYITFGKKDIKKEFEKSNFPKEIVFEKLAIGQMGNYGSVRKILFEINL